MKKEQYKAVPNFDFGNVSQVLLLCFESVGAHTLKVCAEVFMITKRPHSRR
jgi:hypothetical protein